MGKVRVLDEKTSAKIAAGEVIERPASVVKELLENSIDAKAKKIRINIEKGGKKIIEVQDDGEGIEEDDIEKVVQKHATSKISDFSDLQKISTLGFRGEALYSIASVSKLIIRSKTYQAESGMEVVFEAGRKKMIRPLGMNTGTQVRVENLFFNLPARKKFLKSDNTEYKHILNEVFLHALSYPEIEFILRHNDKTILNLQKNSFKKRISNLIHLDEEKFFYIKAEKPPYKLKLFLVRAEFASHFPKISYVFVNRRSVKSPLLYSSLRQALQSFYPDPGKAGFILFFDSDPYLYDVNIHPRKEEIRFLESDAVFSFVYSSVRENLGKVKFSRVDFSGSVLQPLGKKGVEKKKNTLPQVREGKSPYYLEKKRFSFEKKDLDFSLSKSEIFSEDIKRSLEKRDFIQLLDLFIITSKDDNILIIDQHAADERILYEKLHLRLKRQPSLESIDLLIPAIVQLPAVFLSLIEEEGEFLKRFGFEADVFGENTAKISKIPALLERKDFESVFLQILESLNEDIRSPRSEKIDRIIATIACRSAVKQGDRLSDDKIKQILEYIDDPDFITSRCPHGRPTTIVFSKKNLEKLFKRR